MLSCAVWPAAPGFAIASVPAVITHITITLLLGSAHQRTASHSDVYLLTSGVKSAAVHADHSRASTQAGSEDTKL